MVLFLTAHYFQDWLYLSTLQTQHKFLHHSALAHCGLARQQSSLRVQRSLVRTSCQYKWAVKLLCPLFSQSPLRQAVKVCLTGEFLFCSNSCLCNWTKTINSFPLAQQRAIRQAPISPTASRDSIQTPPVIIIITHVNFAGEESLACCYDSIIHQVVN